MPNLKPALLLVPVLASVAGCKEYFTVDEACSDSIAGGKDLLPADFDAMVRVNCYRKLTGLSKVAANSLVNEAAGLTTSYVAANPSVDYFSGDTRYDYWLTQDPLKPGYSAVSVMERLTDPVYGAGYEIFDTTSVIREYLVVKWNEGDLAAPSGAAAVDDLMRDQDFRQLALQPSVVDIAYREVELSGDWFETGGWSTRFSSPPPSGGRAYYLIVLHSEPHLEHAGNPVVLPKEDQTDVPLYSWTHRPVSASDPTRTQLGYAVTFLVGALDPENFKDADANQYAAFVTDFTITGPDGALETALVHPTGFDENEGDILPDPFGIRSVLAGYTREFLAPSTKYDVFAHVESPDNEQGWDFEYSFTTKADDPGMNPAAQILGGTDTTPTTTPTTTTTP